MTQRPKYIQLEPGEDVASVRDRLSFLRGERVLLIWPETESALSRKLDLVLIQREARRKVIQIALVTHDAQVIDHARSLGISTFETMQEAERSRWKRGRTKVFTQRHHKPEDEPDPEDLMPVASRVRRTGRHISRLARIIFRTSVASIVFGVILGALFVVVPTADISLRLAQQPVTVEATIIAQPDLLDLDIENNLIPATIVSATVQTVQQIETTGAEIVDDRRAIGVVTFTNQTAATVEIPAGTIVSTSTSPSVRFQTTVSARLRAGIGERIEVAIEASADSVGNIGNVPADVIDTVSGELQNVITVRNLASTLGGESRTYQTVTQEDQERLLGIVRGQLQAQAYSVMQESLSESQIIVLDTIHIPEDELRDDWISYSHAVGERSGILSLSMRAVVKALVIDDRFARQIVFARLSAQKPAQLALDPDSYVYTRGPVISASPQGSITFLAYGDGLAQASFEASQLQQRIAGLSVQQALQVIAETVDLAPDSTPVINIYPDFMTMMPLLPVRIRIEAER
jgi:hypothetical protein